MRAARSDDLLRTWLLGSARATGTVRRVAYIAFIVLLVVVVVPARCQRPLRIRILRTARARPFGCCLMKAPGTWAFRTVCHRGTLVSDGVPWRVSAAPIHRRVAVAYDATKRNYWPIGPIEPCRVIAPAWDAADPRCLTES